MRDKPIVGQHAWFGPRQTGWGWTPVAWQGWLACSLGLIAIGAATASGGSTAAVVTTVIVAAVLVGLAVLLGTSPSSTDVRWHHTDATLASELTPDDPGLSAIAERIEHRHDHE